MYCNDSILIYRFSQGKNGGQAVKGTIFAAYLALLILAVTAFCLVWRGSGEEEAPPESAAGPTPAASPTSEMGPAASPSPVSSPAPTTELAAVLPAAQAAPERLLVKCGGEVYDVALEEYLVGVVAAEMPAYFEPEALKAQAVAARTYAMYCARTGRHSDADVCTDFACCQAWHSRDTLLQNWGDSFEEHYAAVSQAVNATAGEYLSYEGAPVFAAFHASSCGATEDCGAIWNPLPYLISVSSPETEDTVPGYISQVELSPLDFRDTVLYAYPQADFTGDESAWVGEISRDESGRVSSACLGGVDIAGTELRSLFSLRSTAFTLEYTGSSFLFTVTGHGHGVGMSQHGANLMAAQGSDYTQILAHYYPGTALVMSN